MIRSFTSEWSKLGRRGMIIGGLGTMSFIAIFIAIILFSSAEPAADTPPPSRPGEQSLPTIERLAEYDGVLVGFQFAGNLVGIVALVLFAGNLGSEYSQGTIKVLLSREPRRLRLLLGKLTALALFVGVGVLIALILQTACAYAVATGRDLSTQAWLGRDTLVEGAVTLGRVWASATVWGLMGAALAVLFRSAAPSIGIGIGYTILGEPIVTLVWSDAAKWLPGGALMAFNEGGNPILEFWSAALIMAMYAIVFAAVALTLFVSRDVTT